ncbi:MAG: hypothetical protein RJA70_2910 [Pseudomonadota bacterium]|jgi:hypothetical protein
MNLQTPRTLAQTAILTLLTGALNHGCGVDSSSSQPNSTPSAALEESPRTDGRPDDTSDPGDPNPETDHQPPAGSGGSANPEAPNGSQSETADGGAKLTDAGTAEDAGTGGATNGTTPECAQVGANCIAVGCCEGLTCDGEASTCFQAITPIGPHDRCELPLASGPCRGLFTVYGFDTKRNSCQAFVYGGCGGNDNRFETSETCSQACGARAVPF